MFINQSNKIKSNGLFQTTKVHIYSTDRQTDRQTDRVISEIVHSAL